MLERCSGAVRWRRSALVPSSRLSAGLHELERREFVRPSRTSAVEGEREIAFWRALVRDVAYRTDPAAAARAEAPGRRGLDRREGRRPGGGRRRPARAPPRRGGRALRGRRGADSSRCPRAAREGRARPRRGAGARPRSASRYRLSRPCSRAQRRRARALGARDPSSGRRDPDWPRAGGRRGARRDTPCPSRRFRCSPDRKSSGGSCRSPRASSGRTSYSFRLPRRRSRSSSRQVHLGRCWMR